jgi:hypothetical protein
MCTCASCSYTDKYAGKGFAEWPRGEPAGPRASAAAYAAHVAHLWKGVPRKSTAFTPGQAPQYPSWCSTKAMAPAVLKIPDPCESLAEYVADFDKLNGLKRQEPAKAPARPATISKSPQHFPELDRQPEAITIYDMRKEKAKRSVGRPPMPGRRVVVKLQEKHIAKAIKLGGGGETAMSEGIRKALEAA